MAEVSGNTGMQRYVPHHVEKSRLYSLHCSPELAKPYIPVSSPNETPKSHYMTDQDKCVATPSPELVMYCIVVFNYIVNCFK